MTRTRNQAPSITTVCFEGFPNATNQPNSKTRIIFTIV